MTNERILANWAAILAAVPPDAEFSAMLKTTRNDFRKPIFTNAEFKQNNPPILFSDDDRLNGIDIGTENRKAFFSNDDLLETITGTIAYKLDNNNHDVEFKLHFDGSVELKQSYGPDGETPTVRLFPRAYPTTDILQEELTDNSATFMKCWLEDLFNILKETPRLEGYIKLGDLGAVEYDPKCDPSQIARSLVLKAKRFGDVETFEAHLTRSDAARSDFTDEINIKVTPSRRVRVEYRSDENGSFINGPMSAHTIGNIREGTDLTFVSEFFPKGFAEREPDDFLIRFVNFSTGVTERHPWPNRQTSSAASSDSPKKVTGLISGVRAPFKH